MRILSGGPKANFSLSQFTRVVKVVDCLLRKNESIKYFVSDDMCHMSFEYCSSVAMTSPSGVIDLTHNAAIARFQIIIAPLHGGFFASTPFFRFGALSPFHKE